MKNTAPTDLSSSLSELAAIPGDTYAVKNELKALGAVWDKAERIWRIAPDKLAQARALVEHQALSPTAAAAAGGGGIDLETLADPFEQEGDGPRYTMLSERDGNLYAAKDALKAIGASWDKGNRAWKVREERAEYARAIVASVTDETKEVVPEADIARTKRTPARKPAPDVTAVDAARTLSAQEAPTEKSPAQDGMMLGGLWRRRGADGKVYLSGWLSDTVEIRIVSNDQRVDENDPSHRMYLLPIEPLTAPQG